MSTDLFRHSKFPHRPHSSRERIAAALPKHLVSSQDNHQQNYDKKEVEHNLDTLMDDFSGLFHLDSVDLYQKPSSVIIKSFL